MYAITATKVAHNKNSIENYVRNRTVSKMNKDLSEFHENTVLYKLRLGWYKINLANNTYGEMDMYKIKKYGNELPLKKDLKRFKEWQINGMVMIN